MPRGSRPGEHRGGRKRGTPNRTTTERALKAARLVEKNKAQGRSLAVEVLAEVQELFIAQARHATDLGALEKWGRLAADVAAKLAPFQSPTFRAVDQPAPPPNAAETVRRFTLRVFEQGHEVDHMGTRRIGRMNGATEADTD